MTTEDNSDMVRAVSHYLHLYSRMGYISKKIC